MSNNLRGSTEFSAQKSKTLLNMNESANGSTRETKETDR